LGSLQFGCTNVVWFDLVAEVDVVIAVKPERCRRCQHPLQGEDSQPERHQVTDIPPIKPAVTEYQLYQLGCPACGTGSGGWRGLQPPLVSRRWPG
jgi:zinc-finger binding domain of transposase IS66